MTERRFSPGFRLSRLDIAVLIIGVTAAVGVGMMSLWFGMAIAFVVGHFFLFCNVLRMSRMPELIWAIGFALLALAAVEGTVAWPLVFGLSAGLTVVLAVNEIRRPRYHGVGWRRINPQLPEWWEGRQGRKMGTPA